MLRVGCCDKMQYVERIIIKDKTLVLRLWDSCEKEVYLEDVEFIKTENCTLINEAYLQKNQ